MNTPKASLQPIELTDKTKNHPFFQHLVRVALRMKDHGWIGSKCLTYSMESDQRIRLEYSINSAAYHKRVMVIAEQEKIKVVNNNPTHFKPVGAIVDALHWNIKEIHTNVHGWGEITQSLKQQMRWVDFQYKKEICDTRDEWLGRLMTRSPVLAINESSTPQWLSHIQSILEFEHPLNQMVHQVVSNFLKQADESLRYDTMLRHYTLNASQKPTLCETLDTIIPIMLELDRTWPSIRLHKDRNDQQHLVFSRPDSVIPILHVVKNKETRDYTLLESECKNLNEAEDIHVQLKQAMNQPSIPLKHAWLMELQQLSDFKLLDALTTTMRPDQLWIRSVKNYAEQIHVEMIRNDQLFEPWAKHFSQFGDTNVVSNVLAAMKLARTYSFELEPQHSAVPVLS